jgi:hypothetical protein
MSTSNRTIAVEAAVVSVLVGAGVALSSPRDLWLEGLGFHPSWLPVLLLSARYGTRGLFWSLLITWGSLLFVSAAWGHSLEGAISRARSPSDLLALSGAILVAWIAMRHDGELTRAAQQQVDAKEGADKANETLEALHDSLTYLRARHDRLQASVTFWRDVAGRLERGEPREAAAAALELCAARCGAEAAAVKRWDGTRLSVLAVYGRGGASAADLRDISDDRTARAALAAGAPVLAADIGGARGEDSALVVPIFDQRRDVVLGIIALRGGPPSGLRRADVRDVVAVAGWLAHALARAVDESRVQPVTEEGTWRR